jgi:hypothetical protein
MLHTSHVRMATMSIIDGRELKRMNMEYPPTAQSISDFTKLLKKIYKRDAHTRSHTINLAFITK